MWQRGERHLEIRRMPTVEREYNKVCDPISSWFAFSVISSPSGRSVQARPDPPPSHIWRCISHLTSTSTRWRQASNQLASSTSRERLASRLCEARPMTNSRPKVGWPRYVAWCRRARWAVWKSPTTPSATWTETPDERCWRCHRTTSKPPNSSARLCAGNSATNAARRPCERHCTAGISRQGSQ